MCIRDRYQRRVRGLPSAFMAHQPQLCWVNGKLQDSSLPTISPTDHGYLYGRGAFSSIRIHNGLVELYEEHLAVLKEDCEALSVPWVDTELPTQSQLLELLSVVEGLQGTWRLRVTITSCPSRATKVNVVVTCVPYAPMVKSRTERGETGGNTGSETRLYCSNLGVYPEPVMIPFGRHKCISWIQRFIMADFVSKSEGKWDDVINVSESGLVMETSFANLFWIELKTEEGQVQKQVYIPSRELPYFYGANIRLLEKEMKKKNWVLHFVKQTISQIPSSSFIYRLNSFEFSAVSEIDGRKFNQNLDLEKELDEMRQTYIAANSLQFDK
eukprot:TRINITY_DN1652_c0_g1_i1.p1 TRINITY_DN1652_c0_g1~~TRINITY_DN1652_c0_g1_i1.p1  ORF type:complete len:327 (-),score=83.33 TRINITY_DN1652_c0_g1_i1:94-1074(-)